jgi:hypothetical protein
MSDFQTILFKKQKHKILRASFGGIISSKEVFKMATYHLRIKNDTKPNGAKVSAKAHADYILREGENSQKSDCVFQGHQLPSWADGSAQKFFRAADRYEDKGNRRYKEIEFSLPNELMLEQNREVVDSFIACHLTNHYYAYAIHEKSGAISGERHPHVHIMFSKRLIDEVEKIKERPAYKYFTRAAKPLKGEKVANFERRREHGAPKDKRWHSKKFLYKIREEFARIQNEVLGKYGYSVRVDHRSLKAQKAEAEERGDKFLAKLFDRMPEECIGITSSHRNEVEVSYLKHTREIYRKKFEQLFRQDFQEKVVMEEDVRACARQAEILALSLLSSESYKSEEFSEEPLRKLIQKILTEFEKVKSLRKKVVTGKDAQEKSESEYLSKADRNLLRDYERTLAEKYNWETLMKNLSVPSEKQPKNLQAFQEIERGVRTRISDLKKTMVEMYPKIQSVEEKMKNPYRLKNVHLVTHDILQKNLEILGELKNVSEELMRDVSDYKNLRKKNAHTIFSFSEVREKLSQQCRFLKTEYEKSVDEMNCLRWKVINPMRAISMAENIFVHGGLKKLREEKRKFEKSVSNFERKLAEYQQHEFDFKNANFENSADKIQEQYYLTKEKFLLEAARQNLQNTKNFLESESEKLAKICQTKEARQKISVIAAGILKKNLKTANAYENAKVRSKVLSRKLTIVKNRLEGLKRNGSRKLRKLVFRVDKPAKESVKISSSDPNFVVDLIADALNGNENAVQLVAYCPDNYLEMEKSWSLMSELDKDELIHKKIMRDL